MMSVMMMTMSMMSDDHVDDDEEDHVDDDDDDSNDDDDDNDYDDSNDNYNGRRLDK